MHENGGIGKRKEELKLTWPDLALLKPASVGLILLLQPFSQLPHLYIITN